MVEATKILSSPSQPKTITLKRRYQVFEAFASTNETITLNVGTLVGVGLFKVSDGVSVAFSKSGNVITITEVGLVDEHIVGIGIGSVS